MKVLGELKEQTEDETPMDSQLQEVAIMTRALG